MAVVVGSPLGYIFLAILSTLLGLQYRAWIPSIAWVLGQIKHLPVITKLSVPLLHLLDYLAMLVVVVVNKCHSSVRLLVAFSFLETCITFSTL